MTDFEKIYKSYFQDVFLFLKKLTGNEHIAEELTSETFFKAMKALHNFRGNCEIRVWLCQIAKNCYFSYLKKHQSITLSDTLDSVKCSETDSSPEEMVLVREHAMEIHTLVHQLPEPYKEVFMLRIFGELSFRQIGTIFDKTENWACVTYHRARQKIKEKMEENYDER